MNIAVDGNPQFQGLSFFPIQTAFLLGGIWRVLYIRLTKPYIILLVIYSVLYPIIYLMVYHILYFIYITLYPITNYHCISQSLYLTYNPFLEMYIYIYISQLSYIVQ